MPSCEGREQKVDGRQMDRRQIGKNRKSKIIKLISCMLVTLQIAAYIRLVVALWSTVTDRRRMANFSIFSLILIGVCFVTIKTGIWNVQYL